MLGMKSFYIDSTPSALQFSTSENATTNIIAPNFVSLSFQYWSFKLRECPADYPYFRLED